jgi:hypothetical protein
LSRTSRPAAALKNRRARMTAVDHGRSYAGRMAIGQTRR